MLKIYNVREFFQINRNQWEPCGNTAWTCMDDSESLEEIIILDRCSFDKAFQEIYNKYFGGLYADETIFLHRPYIGVTVDCDLIGKRYFASDIRTISYKRIYHERPHISLNWIAEHLPVEQAIQYLKERGVITNSSFMITANKINKR